MYKRITPMRCDILSLKQTSGPLVYIAWKGSQCLYVGMSSRGLARPFTNQRVLKSGATNLELRWCVDIEAARYLESKLIFDLNPPLNKARRAGGAKLALLTIRVFESDLAEWKRKANLRGLNLSEWIRRQCNEAQTIAEQVNGNGGTNHQDVQRTPESSVSGRRTGTSERRSARRGRNTVRQIEDVTNRVLRTTKRSNRISAGDGASSAINYGLLEAAELVTRENFAEVLAAIPKDEIDRWARNLPPDVLPEHKGHADRNTCLCGSCLSRRKTLDIPYGGMPKKDKR